MRKPIEANIGAVNSTAHVACFQEEPVGTSKLPHRREVLNKMKLRKAPGVQAAKVVTILKRQQFIFFAFQRHSDSAIKWFPFVSWSTSQGMDLIEASFIRNMRRIEVM